MSVDITVPQLGESVVEATIGRWMKKVGDTVRSGESLVELETDKVNMEVPSAADGVLEAILTPDGETVNVGQTIARMSVSGSTIPNVEPARIEIAKSPESAKPSSNGSHAAPPAHATASPVAKALAADNSVDLAKVPGTGPGGKVTKQDVTSFIAKSETASQAVIVAASSISEPIVVPASSGNRREERIRMSRRRQTIAIRLVEAQQTAAMLTTFNEVDMTAIMDIRKRRKDQFKEKHGVNLGFMSFFTRAAIGALKAFPNINAEIQGTDIVQKYYYDIGIAVSTGEGLVVPVVRDADKMSFAEIEKGILDVALRARDNKLTLPELMGGTFTITNGGVFGSLMSTPILNTPQVGILGMHKIQERAMVIEGQIVARPMMYLALSYDHRIVDGSEAVRFLVKVKELIEDPINLMLDL